MDLFELRDILGYLRIWEDILGYLFGANSQMYSHYCIELRINSLFNHEIRLIKEMTKGTMSMHICMSKIGTHRRNFEAKSGPYYPRWNTL